jgi:hypothetical protein
MLLMAILGITGFAFWGTFVYQLSKNVLLGWYCLLAVALMSVATDLSQVTIGGLHLDAEDMVNLSLLAAGVVRFMPRAQLPGKARLIILAYLLSYGFCILRGMVLFGVQAAGNEARGLVGEILAMLYFFTTPTDLQTIRKILTAYLWFGAALVMIAVLHYVGMDIGPIRFDEKDRALPSASGEAIALCFFIGLGWITRRKSPPILRWLLPIFAGMVIVLQHRTVWAVMAACGGAIFFIDVKLVRRLIPMAVLTAVMAVSLAIFIYGTGREASTQFEDSATNGGTLLWRLEAWQNSISDEDQTVVSMIFGQPMGRGFVRFESTTGGYENLPPHSEYVIQYLRFGVVGLFLFLGFLLRPIPLLYALQREDSFALFPSASVWCLIVLGAVVYGIAYGYDAPTMALVGFANALLLSSRSHQIEQSSFAFPMEEPALE